MSAIFISYRRSDDAGEAGRLFDRLKRRFGERVFMDVEGGIRPGEPFAEVIARRLLGCRAALVVIGPRWLRATDARGGRRLDDPEDWVRIEVETALRSGAEVFPVLVDGATMPAAAELPPELAPLAGRQALELRNDSWDFDAGRLIHALEAVVRGGARRRWLAAAGVAVALAAVVVALKVLGGGEAPARAASLEVAIYAVEADERGPVVAASRFESADGSFADSTLERIVDWLADTLNVAPPPAAAVAQVVVEVPADLAARSYRIERIPAGPMEVHLWDVAATGKIRLPVAEGSLRSRTAPFVLEIELPGYGATAIDVTPGVAVLDTLTLAPSSGAVRIGIEDIAGDPGVGSSLTRVLAARPGFTALSPAALEARRRTLAEARQRILENPMAQMAIRESLGADYLLAGSVLRRPALE